jgi:hypothetical protein
MGNSHQFKFKINTDKINDLIDKISDLSTIDSTLRIKIDSDNILMYSTLGGSVMLGFKNYLLNTKEYLDIGNNEYLYDIVVVNSVNLVKNLNFIKDEKNLKLVLTCKKSPDDDEIMFARSLQFLGGRIKIISICGERAELRDINKTVLAQRLNLKNKKWSFSLTREQYRDIKKLSSINSNKIVNINVVDGLVTISETSAWEMEIGEIETKKGSLILNKRFFKSIDGDNDEIQFNMFETFILIKTENSNLMLSYEQDFSDDDI